MGYEIKQDGKFKFIEEGEGEPLILLHGLFGALSNFQFLIEHFHWVFHQGKFWLYRLQSRCKGWVLGLRG